MLSRSDGAPWADMILARAVAAIKGRRWKEIQVQYFPARSRNAIKNQYTILMRRRTKSKSTAKNAAPLEPLDTESSQNPAWSSEEDTDESGQSSDDEDDGTAVERRDPRSSMEGILTQTDTGDTAEGAENITLIQDSQWDMLSGFSNESWDKVLSSMGEPSDTGLYFDGAVPGLPAAIPETTPHGYTHDGGKPDLYSTPAAPLLPAQGRTPVLFSPPDQDGAAMMGVEPTQQEIGTIPHTVTRRGSEGNKVVLIVEDPDKTTVESLMQVVFSSRSRFHLTRE
ncbi:hypothetical protein EYZ11_006998 [Aspergillus tanneri]|uniref:Myb-like domain-containing protein n=1 Tax=Aspergillus tanneri TaxID=1220188 RepID=A0A4S3JGI6_9EURO|nr:hypothetical protein EYZ11_006998 [Aspergillus tanneri]